MGNKQPPKNADFKRTFELRTQGIIDKENRIVEVSFSSEAPVERWFGREILMHTKEAVDFSPLENVGSILINHDPEQRVAKPLQIWLDENEKKGRATIQFGETDTAKKAFEEVQEGLLRGISVGYQINKWREIQESEEWEGFAGPAYIATKWSVYEFSLTPIPADTSVGVGRSKENNQIREIEPDIEIKQPKKREENMDKEKKVNTDVDVDVDVEAMQRDAVKAERERVTEINALCRTHSLKDEFKEKLITDGVSIEESRKAILDELAKQPENEPVGAEARVEMGESSRDKYRQAATDALMFRSGLVEEEKITNNPFVGRTLVDLAREGLERANISTMGMDIKTMVGRAITATSSDFPIALQNIAHKSALDGYAAAAETWQQWCATGSVSDFKTYTAVRMGEFDDLDEVKEGAEYKYAAPPTEAQEQYGIATYGKLFAITRQTIINDDLGMITDSAKSRGEAAARKIGDLVYTQLTSNPKMGDNVTLFNAAHGNLAGTGVAPSVDSIKSAITAMLKQKGLGGKKSLNIRPQFTIVPMSMLMDVEEILSAQYIDFAQGKPNVLRNFNLKPIGENRLDIAGNAWYLAGQKGKTVKVFFLNGQQTPTLEMQNGWTVDGVEYKVRIDVGAKAMDWKALYKNPGA